MSATHTPTPWIASNNAVMSPQSGDRVYFEVNVSDTESGERNLEQEDANAAHIVHCVNSHAALVEALRKLEPLLGEIDCAFANRIRSDRAFDKFGAIAEQARDIVIAALASAGSQT